MYWMPAASAAALATLSYRGCATMADASASLTTYSTSARGCFTWTGTATDPLAHTPHWTATYRSSGGNMNAIWCWWLAAFSSSRQRSVSLKALDAHSSCLYDISPPDGEVVAVLLADAYSFALRNKSNCGSKSCVAKAVKHRCHRGTRSDVVVWSKQRRKYMEILFNDWLQIPKKLNNPTGPNNCSNSPPWSRVNSDSVLFWPKCERTCPGGPRDTLALCYSIKSILPTCHLLASRRWAASRARHLGVGCDFVCMVYPWLLIPQSLGLAFSICTISLFLPFVTCSLVKLNVDQ